MLDRCEDAYHDQMDACALEVAKDLVASIRCHERYARDSLNPKAGEFLDQSFMTSAEFYLGKEYDDTDIARGILLACLWQPLSGEMNLIEAFQILSRIDMVSMNSFGPCGRAIVYALDHRLPYSFSYPWKPGDAALRMQFEEWGLRGNFAIWESMRRGARVWFDDYPSHLWARMMLAGNAA
jgi:hypothetical protein